jgi:hypothetical protein
MIYTMNRGGWKVYSVADYYEGKRKIQQFTDYKKAKDEARKITRQLSDGQHKVLSLSDDNAWTLHCLICVICGLKKFKKTLRHLA